jgi:hypothetical protein
MDRELIDRVVIQWVYNNHQGLIKGSVYEAEIYQPKAGKYPIKRIRIFNQDCLRHTGNPWMELDYPVEIAVKVIGPLHTDPLQKEIFTLKTIGYRHG